MNCDRETSLVSRANGANFRFEGCNGAAGPSFPLILLQTHLVASVGLSRTFLSVALHRARSW